MNQEQLIDHVYVLLNEEAKKGPGTLLLVHDTDFRVIRLQITLSAETKVIHIVDADGIKNYLSPSAWMNIAKKVWAVTSQPSNVIKFPGQPSAGRGKPGRKPQPQDEDPKSG